MTGLFKVKNNTRVQLENFSTTTVKKFSNILTFIKPYNPFGSTFTIKKWLTDTGTFPIGFLQDLVLYCDSVGIEYSIEGLPEYYSFPVEVVKDVLNRPVFVEGEKSIALWDHQKKGILHLLKNKGGVLSLATGAGKTIMTSTFLDLYFSHHPSPGRVLFIVDSISLLGQAYDVFTTSLPDVKTTKFFGDEKNTTGQIVVAVIDSLVKHRKALTAFFKDVDVLIYDEVHNSGNSSTYEICKRIPAKYRIGLSGTPFDSKNEYRNSYIKGNFGDTVYSVTAKELVNLGILMQPKLFVLPRVTPNIPKLRMRTGNKRMSKLDMFVRQNDDRNEIIASLCKYFSDHKLKTLVVANTVTQIDYICNVLERKEINYYKMIGATRAKQRKQFIENFKNDEDQNLLIGTVLNEGLDIPVSSCIIIADGGKVEKNAIQRLGRILRKKEGKTLALLIEFSDIYFKKRRKFYEEEGWKINSFIKEPITAAMTKINETILKEKQNVDKTSGTSVSDNQI